MAGSLNKVMIIGNVGRAPEMRYTSGGIPITTFSVATTHTWRDQGGERHEETEWFNIVAWNKLAETCNQYIQKGQKVYIEGRLRTNSWNDQQGVEHRRIEVIANTMLLLSPKPKPVMAVPGEENTYLNSYANEEMEAEDLPF